MKWWRMIAQLLPKDKVKENSVPNPDILSAYDKYSDIAL